MLIHPQDLKEDLDRLEEIERASLRLVVQALVDFREDVVAIFQEESDLAADIGEDITREALDRMGMSKIDQRLFGKMDYKRARYLFHPEYAIKQALFVDSKAEKVGGKGTATLQTSQLSMMVRQVRSGQSVNVPGKLPPLLRLKDHEFITTTIFVKYNYDEKRGGRKALSDMMAAAVPNGFLQEKYNPNCHDTIWIAGRNAPSRGEEFRVRLSFHRLKDKAKWRVQKIPLSPAEFHWQD